MKIIDKTQLNSSSLQKLFREVRIMKVLNHPNIGEKRGHLSSSPSSRLHMPESTQASLSVAHCLVDSILRGSDCF